MTDSGSVEQGLERLENILADAGLNESLTADIKEIKEIAGLNASCLEGALTAEALAAPHVDSRLPKTELERVVEKRQPSQK